MQSQVHADNKLCIAADDQICLWCTHPCELIQSEAYRRAAKILSADEQAELRSFRHDADQRLHLASRALVRTVLSKYTPMPPTAWRFIRGLYGRPEITGPNELELRFSSSKTNDLVVCGITRRSDIGVDVENTTRSAPLEVVGDCFSRREVAAFQQLPSNERADRFYQLWTLKESYLKARGLGLSAGLNRFSFHFDGQKAPRLEVDDGFDAFASSWQFLALRPTPEYLAAVCVNSSDSIARGVSVQWHTFLDVPPADGS